MTTGKTTTSGGKPSHGRKGHSDRPGRPDWDSRPRRESGDRDKPRKFGSRGAPVEEETSERIAKRLARAGVASRREAETMIAAGRIAVNGKVLESPAVNVKRTDIITVDGKAVEADGAHPPVAPITSPPVS